MTLELIVPVRDNPIVRQFFVAARAFRAGLPGTAKDAEPSRHRTGQDRCQQRDHSGVREQQPFW